MSDRSPGPDHPAVPEAPDGLPRGATWPAHRPAKPSFRAHWAVLAAGLVLLGVEVWLQRAQLTPGSAVWFVPLSIAVYVLSVALIAAGVVGWLVSRYLGALVDAAAAAASDAFPSPEELDEDPPASVPLPAPGVRGSRVPTPTVAPRPERSEPPAEDDHSLWRP